MKKILITLIAVVALAGAANAQSYTANSYVQFGNVTDFLNGTNGAVLGAAHTGEAATMQDANSFYRIDGAGNLYLGATATAQGVNQGAFFGGTNIHSISANSAGTSNVAHLSAAAGGYAAGDYVQFTNVANLVAGTNGTLLGNANVSEVASLHDGTHFYRLDAAGTLHVGSTAIAPGTNLGAFFAGTNVRSISSKGAGNYVVHLSADATAITPPKPRELTVAIYGAGKSDTPEFDINLTFSEAITGLGAADFQVSNGTVTAVTAQGRREFANKYYTISIRASAPGQVQVSLPVGVVTSSATPLLPNPASQIFSIQCNADFATHWTIDDQASWTANKRTSSNMTLSNGFVEPTATSAQYSSTTKTFSTKRRARSVVFEQSPVWDNWKDVSNIGPSGAGDAPILLPVADNDYYLLGLGSTGGYHAWHSTDMVNWTDHGAIASPTHRWVTTAEYKDGTFYIYVDHPNDHTPALYTDTNLKDGIIGTYHGVVFPDPTHGSDCSIIRDNTDGRFHLIHEDWTPINASSHSWDSPLAGHVSSPDGGLLTPFLPAGHLPSVDVRTTPTGQIGTYRSSGTHRTTGEYEKNFKYDIHSPAQDAFGDWTTIKVGSRFYLFGDYDPHGQGIRSARFTSDSIYEQFEQVGELGSGHPDPSIGFAEGEFHLITQQSTDYTSPGPWVDGVEARAGVDVDGDGKIDQWTTWQGIQESYSHTPGYARVVTTTPAQLDLRALPEGLGFQFEFRVDNTKVPAVSPIMDKMTMTFEPIIPQQSASLPVTIPQPHAAYPKLFSRPPSQGNNYDTWADAHGPDIGERKLDPKRLPNKVDNSRRPEYPSIYNQGKHGVCGQYAAVASIFTYEQNVLNKTKANSDATRFSPYFSWNMVNKAKNTGSEAFHGWEVAKRLGIPTAKTYGGVKFPTIGLWPDGYPIWREAMEYRVSGYRYTPVGSLDQLNEAKGWLFDRNQSGKVGGLLAMDGRMGKPPERTVTIPKGEYEAGKLLWTRWNPSGFGHGMACVGYDDEVGYDVNGDGKITNDLDTNNDGKVTMADWERGAFIVVNSWGEKWSADGRIYLLYSAMIDPDWKRGNYLGRIEVARYQPRTTLRLKLSCNERSNLRTRIGIASDVKAETAEHEIKPQVLNGWPMFKGGNPGAVPIAGPGKNKVIELGVDVSDLMTKLKTKGDNKARMFIYLGCKKKSKASGKLLECALRHYGAKGQLLGETPIQVIDGNFGEKELVVTGVVPR